MPNDTSRTPNNGEQEAPPLTALSLFAGIGGFDLGFEQAGIRVIAQCEIDPHAASVLRRHWPDVPVIADVTTLNGADYVADIIMGGFPCQDLSVAGKREGLSGGRSGLFYEIVRIAHEMQEATNGQFPRWVVLENVPGAYSSNGGRDFAAVLASLVGGEVGRPAGGWSNAGVAFGPLGSVEWRVLDSQHFGVAQRRRRVFVVYRPGGERAGEVLLEPAGVPGHPPKGRAPGERVAPTLEGRAGRSGATNFHTSGGLVETVAPTVTASWGHHGHSSPRGDGTDPIVPVAFKVRGGKEGGGKGYLGKALTISTVQEQYLAEPIAFAPLQGGRSMPVTAEAPTLEAGTGNKAPAVAIAPTDTHPTLNAAHGGKDAGPAGLVPVAFALRGRDDGAVPEVSGDKASALRGAAGGSSRDYVAFDLAQITSQHNRSRAEPGLPAGTLAANSDPHVATPYAVRRLTPKECERLQGFPDGWTAHDHEGREIADTHRYRMLGNAVTVTVANWIAHRIRQAA